MLFNKLMSVAFYAINLLWLTFGKYLIINVKEQNQEHVVAMENNQNVQWKVLEDNEVINLPHSSHRMGGLCSGPPAGCTLYPESNHLVCH